MSLADKINNIAGALSTADTDAQTDWLAAGSKLITDRLPESIVEKYTVDINVLAAGTDITTYRLLNRTHKDGYQSIQVPVFHKTQVLNSKSIHYAVTKSPAHYIENGKIYLAVNGELSTGTALGMAYPAPTYDATTISGFPLEYEYGVILYSAIQQRLRQIADKLTSLEGISLDTTTAPTAPAAPAISYTDAIPMAVVAVTVGALGTAPSYTKPTIAMTAAPTIADLNLSSITPPTAPDAPAIAYSDTIPINTVATTVSALGTAPSYQKPVPALSTPPVISDLTISATAPTPPSAASITSPTSVMGTIIATSIGAIPTAPVYTAPSFGGVYTNTDTALTNQDIELANGHLNKIQNQLSQYNEDIANGSKTFESNLAKFNADVQKLLNQAAITQQENIRSAELFDDIQKFNATQSLNADIEEAKLILEKYSSDVNLYAQQVISEVQAFRANFEKNFSLWQNKRANELQQYSSDIQNEFNKFNKELSVYQTDANHKIEQARITLQQALTDAQNTNNIRLQNEIQTAQVQLENYAQSFVRYNGLLSAYVQQVASAVQQFRANFDKEFGIWQVKRDTELRQYSADIENELGAFNKDLAYFRADLDQKITQAQISIQKSLKDAEDTNNIALQNEIQTLQAQIADYSAKLGLYNAQLGVYGTTVGLAVSKYQTQINQKIAEKDTLLQGLEALKKEFENWFTIKGL